MTIEESDEVDFSLCVAAELPKGYYRNKPLGIGKPVGEENTLML